MKAAIQPGEQVVFKGRACGASLLGTVREVRTDISNGQKIAFIEQYGAEATTTHQVPVADILSPCISSPN